MNESAKKDPSRQAASSTALDAERELHIRNRAYELYELRGMEPGHDLDDWLQAEQEILSADAPALVRKAAA